MVLKSILRFLIFNPQLVKKLVNPNTIRRAAETTGYAIQKSKIVAQDVIEGKLAKRALEIQKDFFSQVTKAIEEGKKEALKKK